MITAEKEPSFIMQLGWQEDQKTGSEASTWNGAHLNVAGNQLNVVWLSKPNEKTGDKELKINQKLLGQTSNTAETTALLHP